MGRLIFLLLLTAVATEVSLCQTYIGDLVSGCVTAGPICGTEDDYKTISSFSFDPRGDDYAEICKYENEASIMFSIDNENNYVRDVVAVVPHSQAGCKVYTSILLRSRNKFNDFRCTGNNTVLDLFSAKMESVASVYQNTTTYLFCNGSFVPGEFNSRNTTVTRINTTLSETACSNSVDLSAAGVGWNKWFDDSSYTSKILSLGQSIYLSAIKAKQWQTACIARNGSVIAANEVVKENLVKKQMDKLMSGRVPTEFLSTTRAQYSSFSSAGKVEQLVLYSDNLCTYNEVGKCLTQIRYYCQPNATTHQNSGQSIYYNIPNGCFFQMRTRNAGPGNSSANPLFDINGPKSGSYFLENAQHTVDWEDQNDIYVTYNNNYTQISLLPQGATDNICKNASISTAIPFYNKLFGISNVRMVAKNSELCVLGNATTPYGFGTRGCVSDFSKGPLLLFENITDGSNIDTSTCLDSSVGCEDGSQIIFMGARLGTSRYEQDCDLYNDCELSPAYSATFVNETCYSWYVNGGDIGTYEVVNSTNLTSYLNMTKDEGIFKAYVESDEYIGYGDGILCGQHRDMMLAAAQCYTQCYNNITNSQRSNPCNIDTTLFGTRFNGSHCSTIFSKYTLIFNQLGVPLQHTLESLAGTLGSSRFRIFNKNILDLGNIQDVNTPVTSGAARVEFPPAQALLNKYQDGHCYIPLSAMSGYKQSDEGSNIPEVQGLSQLQTEANVAELAEELQNSIQSLQNAALQETPAVNLATIILTITSCLGALTGVKVLELYITVSGISKFIKNKPASYVTKRIVIVAVTLILTAFSVAPAIAMFVQENQARQTRYSTTYGDYIQNDIPGASVSTLSFVAVTVTYVQDTPYGAAVDVVFYAIIILSAIWWVYATASILINKGKNP